MTPQQKRYQEYLDAIERLSLEGHCIAYFNLDVIDFCKRKCIATDSLLDEYGSRYLATHFPEYNKYPATVKPFLNSADEIQAREYTNAAKRSINKTEVQTNER